MEDLEIKSKTESRKRAKRKIIQDVRCPGYKRFTAKTPAGRVKQLENLSKRWSDKGKAKFKHITTGCLKDMDIITFATEVLDFKQAFADRPAWEVILRVQYGLPLDEKQIEIYKVLTKNLEVFEPTTEKIEGIWALGARGGKSTLGSVIALYESICRADRWRKYLMEGETGYAVIIATKQKQAEDIVQDRCRYILENSKASYMIADAYKAELILKNGLCIASYPCNSTAARGLPIFLLIFDELAHYRTEGPKADEAIYSSLRPRQAQFPGAKCLKFSTPGAQQGLFWDEFKQGTTIPGRLTIQAPSLVVNPKVDRSFVDKEYLRDPENAAREFGAEFAVAVSGFFANCVLQVERAIKLTGDLTYNPSYTYYVGADQSGLAGRDRFAFSIAHREGDMIYQDVLREWATKDAKVIVEEIKGLCANYATRNVIIDRYAAGWVTSLLEGIGLETEKSELLPVIYTNMKTLILADKVALQNSLSLHDGLLSTQAYYGRNNSLTICHERTSEGHGDTADATARAIFNPSKSFTVDDLIVQEGVFDDEALQKERILDHGLRRNPPAPPARYVPPQLRGLVSVDH